MEANTGKQCIGQYPEEPEEKQSPQLMPFFVKMDNCDDALCQIYHKDNDICQLRVANYHIWPQAMGREQLLLLESTLQQESSMSHANE